MQINKQNAVGIKIVGKDFEYVKALRKPNANTNILAEWRFAGKAKDYKKILNKKDKIKWVGEEK